MFLVSLKNSKRRLGRFGKMFPLKNWLQCHYKKLWLPVCLNKVRRNGKTWRKGYQTTLIKKFK